MLTKRREEEAGHAWRNRLSWSSAADGNLRREDGSTRLTPEHLGKRLLAVIS